MPLPKDKDEYSLIEGEATEIDNPNMPAKLSDKILAGLENDDVGMTVSRRVKGKKRAFLFELDEFEDLASLMSLLRDDYGGGDFIIEGKYGNGTWAFQQTITVEPPLNKKGEETQQSGNDIAALISTMNESNRAQMDMMREQMHNLSQVMMQAQLESAKSQSDMLVKMMEINSHKKDDTMTPQDIITMMASFKELSGNNNDNPMELFIKGMEFGRESESGKDDSILQTALKTFGAPLATLATGGGQLPGSASLPGPIPPTQNEAKNEPENIVINKPQPPSEPRPENEEQAQMLAILKQYGPYINMLLQAAANDSDPEAYAVMITDNMPEDAIMSLLGNEEKYSALFTHPMLANSLAPHKKWFDELRDTVIEYLHDEQEPEKTNVSEQSESTDISEAPASDISGDTETTP